MTSEILVTLKSKKIALHIVATKVCRLFGKTWRALTTDPKRVPKKIQRKLRRIILNRLDVGFMFRSQARIGGNYYPYKELLAAKKPASPAIPMIFVIIPVYRNVAVTRRCIDSVLASELPQNTRVLILNDCSPDPDMRGVLESYKSSPHVDVRHNAENLGFVRNVNLGMELAGESDVVLLNSDTVVSGDWLQRLFGHSQSFNLVSSVTATSNNATICSFPVMEGRAAWPLGLTTAKVQSIFGQHQAARSIEIPTAVGFCMYITRRSLKALGAFDAEAFGRGYGEENDFCLRGLKQGWKHLQALDVAVFHEGEVSFGESSHPGKERAREIILKRYPDYEFLVGEFAQKDPARALRLGALLGLLAQSDKPTELICTHIHGGGVAKAVEAFTNAQGKAANFLVLKRANEKGFYQFSSLTEGLVFEIEFSSQYAPEVFAAVLKTANVSKLHIHHVMDFDVSMLRLLQNVDVPFEFFIHDYWTICPQVTLTTTHGRYCGEPDAGACNLCIAKRGERTHAPLAAGLSTEITSWRNQYAWLFAKAQAIYAPSKDVVRRMKKYHPKAEIHVRYHEDQAPLKKTPIKLRSCHQDQKLRVAILGSIGVHKGLYLVSSLQAEIEKSNAPIELVIIGSTDPILKMSHPVRETGPYMDADLPALLTKSLIQVIWFPEGAPETYSYTLSHAMREGYPVVAPEIGAFPERLTERPWTILTKLNESPQNLLTKFLTLRDQLCL